MSGKNGKAKVVKVKLSSIRRDPAVQARVGLDAGQLESICQAIRDGTALPPPVVFQDPDGVRWLGGGFHRAEGYEAEGREVIPVELREGTRRDAMLYAIGDNASPGVLRRTNADKRKAVEMLLADEEWGKWSQTKIARAVGVSQQFVSKVVGERPGSDHINGLSYNNGSPDNTTDHDSTANGASTEHQDTAPVANGVIASADPPTDPETPARQPGDDTEAVAAEEAAGEPPAKPPKAPPPPYALAEFESKFRALFGEIDALAEAYHAGETPEGDRLRTLLSQYHGAYEEWHHALVKAARKEKARGGQEEVKDALGKTVPPRLRDVFADDAVPAELARVRLWAESIRFKAVARAISRRASSYPYLAASTVEGHLEEGFDSIRAAAEFMAQNLPYAVCPVCAGSGKCGKAVCQACRAGCGYVTRWRHAELKMEGKA